MLCLRATFAPTQKYVVKFGPRRETMKEAIKEIIEADTDDMKEVLCLGATFAPTQQFMLSNLGQGGRP